MYNPFFLNPKVWQHLHVGPLSPYVDAFAQYLLEQGYATSSAYDKLHVVAKLSRWLEEHDLSVKALNEQHIAAFLHQLHRRQQRAQRGDLTTVQALLQQLRSCGIIETSPTTIDNSALAQLERDFAQYLTRERGLTPATVINYVPVARRFLTTRFGNGSLELGELDGQDVTHFVLNQASHYSPRSAQLMTTALRSFFRFLRLRGALPLDLMAAVPTVASWRCAEVPKYLQPDQIEQLLLSCPRRTAVGLRDYAILLLLARLGLRAGELARLSLDDIDWHAGWLTVRGKGSRLAQLPLPVDVGDALASYLRDGRPKCTTRCVFVRSRAPYLGFAGASAIDCIVRVAITRAGLKPTLRGAHLLRHSLATRMLRQGASMAEIGQILRHRLPQTTEIYAKVDQTALRALAQPWPGEQA
jgi:site-specific recombinase XerD